MNINVNTNIFISYIVMLILYFCIHIIIALQ